MFKKFLGKSETELSDEEKSKQELKQKISKMNITEMRSYVNNKIPNLEVSDQGLVLVMKNLVVADSESEKFYLKEDDMDSKKKKAFDLVLVVAKSKKINIKVVELIQNFTVIYEEMIKKFDTDYKDIYASRFADALKLGLKNLNKVEDLKLKMNVLKGQ